MPSWIRDPANWASILSWTTAITLVIFAWAMLGAIVIALRRYPPQRGRSREDVIAGRRTWAIVFVLLGLITWSIYRLYVLSITSTPLNVLAFPVEAVRVWSGLYLVWAFRPGSE